MGAVTGPLLLTGHPLQRCGARVITAMADRDNAVSVTDSDLDQVASKVNSDVVRAAVADQSSTAYDWWKVLNALYPNSPATHSKRPRDGDEFGSRIAALFAPDDLSRGSWRCGLCGQPASVVLSKATLPMFDTAKFVNTVPADLAGWPVCRGCRIAMWALPYGSWVTAGSAAVLTCPADDVEVRFVRRNLLRSAQIRQLGFTGVPSAASPETVTLGALRAVGFDAPGGATLWIFKNDNQEPWLRVMGTRGGTPGFLRRMFAEPACRRGWAQLQRTLTRRDKQSGAVTVNGTDAAAKTLFDPADQPGQPAGSRLPRELLRLARDIDQLSGRTAQDWAALFRLYLEVMDGMDVSQVKPVRELITDWITRDTNRRGRFNEYHKVAGSAYQLHRLLMKASARVFLDGGTPPDITAVAATLLSGGQDGWRLRALLFFDVIADLVSHGVDIGQKMASEDEESGAMLFDPDPVTGMESEDYR